jgi:1,2-phenylacetyl-CoA epoxidase catalytic subunit
MLTCASGDDHSANHARELAQNLLRRAVRQLALLRVSAAGLAYAPTLDDRLSAAERARERLLQLERAADCYAELTAADLMRDAEQLLGTLEPPSSWLEASLAQLLLCVAACVELESPQVAEQLPDALACETEHLNAARAALHDLGALSSALRGRLQEVIPRWFTIAYGSLEPERSGSLTSALDVAFQPLDAHVHH